MDPTIALANARQALADLLAANGDHDAATNDAEIDAAINLADAFDALDGWLSKGGFLPDQWEFAPTMTPEVSA